MQRCKVLHYVHVGGSNVEFKMRKKTTPSAIVQRRYRSKTLTGGMIGVAYAKPSLGAECFLSLSLEFRQFILLNRVSKINTMLETLRTILRARLAPGDCTRINKGRGVV